MFCIIAGIIVVHEFGHFLIYKYFNCEDIGFGVDNRGIYTTGTCSVQVYQQQDMLSFDYELLFFSAVIFILSYNLGKN